MDTQDFLRIVRKYVKRNYPGCKAETVTIRLHGGERVRIPVVGDKPRMQVVAAHENIEENEMFVLDFIPEHDKPGESARTIARKADMTYNSWFRTILGSLRKKHKVVSAAGGYRKARAEVKN